MFSYLCSMKSTTKTNQFLRAIMLLSRGRYYTTALLAEELDLELRTVYRYVDDLKNSPFFQFEKRGRKFRLSRASLFWNSIVNSLYITDPEAEALSKFLDEIDSNDKFIKSIQLKVRNIVGNYVAPYKGDPESRLAQNTAFIQNAMDNKQLCLLRGYSSVHSSTKTDRLVEPYLFLGTKNDVRCYELSTQQNKTFKVSRCDSVEVLDVAWQFEKKHKQMYTDIFHFSDEQKVRVRLLLGNLSKTVLLEEYPNAEPYLIPHHDGRWMLDAEYCSMKGVGRFYLGLFEDIEIFDSPEFKTYITKRVALLTEQSK